MYLKDKIALITGISKGIGKATALQLLQHGASVVGWGKTPPEYKNPKLHFISCDVSDAVSVKNAMDATKAITGEIHFLINNAGFGYFSPIESFEDEKWHEMLNVNLTGAYNVTKAIVPLMKEKRAGHILNISSIAGRVGMAQGSGYNASKFGLAGFSECLFHELRKDGIKVSTVYPGSVRTAFFDPIPGIEQHENMMDPEDIATSILHCMNTPPNYVIREIEIRPLVSRAPK